MIENFLEPVCRKDKLFNEFFAKFNKKKCSRMRFYTHFFYDYDIWLNTRIEINHILSVLFKLKFFLNKKSLRKDL
jgi:hypothetical protein